MMRFMSVLRVAVAIGAAGLLGACSDGWATTQVTPTAAAAGRAATPADKIQIFEGDITDRPYKSLGDVSATVNKVSIMNADPTREMVNARLKTEAAKLGADAVIQVRYGTVGMAALSWGALDGKGRAIAYDKP
jgi:basic membrane lipoprotein Med (substrate-binding protein (PBP1-ABC) superfamily)